MTGVSTVIISGVVSDRATANMIVAGCAIALHRRRISDIKRPSVVGQIEVILRLFMGISCNMVNNMDNANRHGLRDHHSSRRPEKTRLHAASYLRGCEGGRSPERESLPLRTGIPARYPRVTVDVFGEDADMLTL